MLLFASVVLGLILGKLRRGTISWRLPAESGNMLYMPMKPLDGFLGGGDRLIARGMFLLIIQVMGNNVSN